LIGLLGKLEVIITKFIGKVRVHVCVILFGFQKSFKNGVPGFPAASRVLGSRVPGFPGSGGGSGFPRRFPALCSFIIPKVLLVIKLGIIITGIIYYYSIKTSNYRSSCSYR
jgi:hypothetical protein